MDGFGAGVLAGSGVGIGVGCGVAVIVGALAFVFVFFLLCAKNAAGNAATTSNAAAIFPNEVIRNSLSWMRKNSERLETDGRRAYSNFTETIFDTPASCMVTP